MPDTPVAGAPGLYAENLRPAEASTSGVAWPAIIGGAFAAAALSLILMALGSVLGLASVSPWSGSGASVTTFTVMTAIWLIVIQWLASGVGGYVSPAGCVLNGLACTRMRSASATRPTGF